MIAQKQCHVGLAMQSTDPFIQYFFQIARSEWQRREFVIAFLIEVQQVEQIQHVELFPFRSGIFQGLFR